MCSDDRIEFSRRSRVDGDFDAYTLDPSRMPFQESRLVEESVRVDGVVDLLAGVEEWEGFGTNSLARSKDCVVDEFYVRRSSSFCVPEAAQCTCADDIEQSFVDHTANF